MFLFLLLTFVRTSLPRLGIGLRELAGGVIVVHTFTRVNDSIGAAEAAGLRLGDILLGANSLPFPGGLERVVDLLKAAQEREEVLKLQVSRDLAITPEKPSQPIFVYVSELLSKTAAYYRARVLDQAERYKLVGMILGLMASQVRCQPDVQI